MNHKVGIWIDHKKAVIVSTSADRVTAKTLESGRTSRPLFRPGRVPDVRWPAGWKRREKIRGTLRSAS
jgi:hypothetical protein